MINLFEQSKDVPHYVYIVKCSSGNYYTGCTNNLNRRLDEQNRGKVKSTSYRAPVQLVTFIGFDNIYSAYKFEKYLKSGSGRAFMKKRFI
jgi:predicted GIY-YIG superfamily endonuclease